MSRFAYIILATLALGSCNTSDEGLQPDLAEHNEIIVAPTLSDHMTTKGAIMESITELQSSTFMLYATAYDSETSADYAVVESEIGYTTSGGWSPTEGHKIYWPTSESDVTFYAWHPADLEPAYCGDKNLYFACDTKAAATPTDGSFITLHKDDISGDVVHYYNGAAGLQDDLMCCTTTMKNPTQQSVEGYESIDSSVDIEFMHALTNLKFQYKTVDGVEVRIKAMTLHNIVSKGGFYSYSSGSYEWATYGDYYADTRPNYQCVPMAWGNSDFVASTHNAVAINGENDLFVFPQTVTAWVPNDGTYTYSIAANDGADGAKRAYLQIYCDIETTHASDKHGDDMTYGSEESMELDPQYCIYVPISSKDSNGDEAWKAGNIVTYTLTFGTGYNADGTKNNDLIPDTSTLDVTVTATLNGWSDGGSYGVEF